jgi:hypothetical protein
LIHVNIRIRSATTAGGRDQDRHRCSAAKQGYFELALDFAAQHTGHEAYPPERCLIRSQGDFVIGPAGEKIIDGRIEPSPRLT